MSDHFPLDNFKHERPISALSFRSTVWPSLGQLIGCTWPKWIVCYPHAKGAEEIAESPVMRQVLKEISVACFARVAWRQPRGKVNNEA